MKASPALRKERLRLAHEKLDALRVRLREQNYNGEMVFLIEEWLAAGNGRAYSSSTVKSRRNSIPKLLPTQ